MTDTEYKDLLDKKVLPEFKSIYKRVLQENLIQAQVSYGWFPCYRKGEDLVIEHNDREVVFSLPRQKHSPGKSLVDFFRTEEEGKDYAGFFVATLGKTLGEMCQKLYAADKYHEYLLLHGFGVESAEALAQYTHNLMRKELQIDGSGQRYSFGYSACPDLELQKPLFSLLQAEDIGVKLSSSCEMIPELSVSALVVHHPQATYFAV